MQLALHFDEDIMNQGGELFWPVLRTLFTKIMHLGRPEITSQVFVGSLLLHRLCYERSEEREGGWTERFNREHFKDILDLWANPPQQLYCTFGERTIQTATNGKLFVVCLASIDRATRRRWIRRSSNQMHTVGQLRSTAYPPHVVLFPMGLRKSAAFMVTTFCSSGMESTRIQKTPLRSPR